MIQGRKGENFCGVTIFTSFSNLGPHGIVAGWERRREELLHIQALQFLYSFKL